MSNDTEITKSDVLFVRNFAGSLAQADPSVRQRLLTDYGYREMIARELQAIADKLEAKEGM